MKRVAIASAFALALATAHAGDGHALTINASVLGACRFAVPASTLGFVLDPLASALSGSGNGKPRTLSVTVSISQPAAANVSGGTYTDTISITLNP